MNPLTKIVIVGGGTSGWLAAAMLSHHLRKDLCQIEVVESSEVATIGIGESTVPPFVGLLQRLGIDEQDFVKATRATYKLGIKFVDWQQRANHYFHPFGVLGKRIGSYDFYQCWLKARAAGDTSSLQDFSPCNVMAEHGRFFLPINARSTPIGGANYALHVDATLAADYLKKYAQAKGIKRTQGFVTTVAQREDGFIDHLKLRDGTRIDGDFFIDCTGFKALLMEKALGVGFDDWSEYLPCDRAVAVKAQAQGPTLPYTLATARKAGWSWRIPLQENVGHGYVYASRFCTDHEAKATLIRGLDGAMVGEPKTIPFVSGHRREFWRNNCLALGLASGFIEPLESTSIHLIARGIDFFLRYFPDRDCDSALIREYNRRMVADYEEVRDFIMLHYCATQREDTPFWRWCRTISLPDSLQERIELFKGHGALREGVDELFRNASWQLVFEGMGIRPKKHCPRVDNLDLSEISATLKMARNAIHGMVKTLPSHDEFLYGEKARF
jgi:tryptophan halogenase